MPAGQVVLGRDWERESEGGQVLGAFCQFGGAAVTKDQAEWLK